MGRSKHGGVSGQPAVNLSPPPYVRGLGVVHNLTPPTMPRPKRRHVRPMPPTHSGPSSQSLVITTGIPPITVRYRGEVREYSRHQIARGTGLSPATVSVLFTGTRNLTLRTALLLRNFLGCSLDYLVDTLIPESQHRVMEAKNMQLAKILNERR